MRGSRIASFGTGLIGVCLLALAVGSTGCSMRTRSRHDPAYDFGAAQSFSWLRPDEIRSTEARLPNDELDTMIRRVIADAMQDSGYVQSDRSRSQILLDYRASLEKRKDVVPLGHDPDNNTARDIEDYDRGTEHGPRWGMRFAAEDGWTWSEGESESYERHYEEGTLVMTMYDARTRHRVWRGSVQAVIDRGVSVADNRRRVEDAVRTLLQRIPGR